MKFESPLIPARFLRRYKRFFCEARLIGGGDVTAHCPNPGSMRGLLEPEAAVWLSRSDNPRRKLGYRWELVQSGPELVGINTGFANSIVAEALSNDLIPPLAGYERARREVPYGEKSRIDFLLESTGREPCFLEIKSATMSRSPGVVEFPDSVTARGRRHLEALTQEALRGRRAVLLFLAQRTHGQRMAIAADIDRAYTESLEKAVAAGVEVLAYGCKVSPEAIELDAEIPLDLKYRWSKRGIP